MAKVYAVTQGEYSDYRVVGVFSSVENAEAFMAHFWSGERSEYDGPGIEELELDPAMVHVRAGHKLYWVRMDREGNSQVELRDDGYYGDMGQSPFFDIKGNLVWSGYAEDEQHAVKIANEKRAEYLASGKPWGMPF